MNTIFYTFLRNTTLTLLLLATAVTQMSATHSTGADISYQWITGNVYRIQVTFYRDCEGIAPTTPQVQITGCGTTARSLTLTQDGPPVEISPLCASSASQSTCRGGTQPGIQKYIYSAVIDLGGTCAAWNFSYTNCCRNGAIDDIQNPLNQNIYVEATLNNVVVPNNNSAVFTNDPVPYICIGFPFTYNHGAFDADGDSLVYSLITPRTSQNVPVTYLAGFSAQNPLTTSPPNSTVFYTYNGQMTFTPAVQQNGVVAILVREYRNGVLIGSTVRDMQIITRAGGCTNSSPSFGAPTNISSGAVYNSTTQTFRVCVGSLLSFSVTASDANPGTILTTTAANLAASLPGSTITYTGSNPRTATITWTPTVGDVGFHTIGLNVSDNSCPIIGTGSTAFNVDVPGLTGVGTNRFTVCRGTNANIQLSASVSGAATGSFNWTATPAAVSFTPSSNVRNPIVAVNKATVFTCTYTENGCVSSDTVVIRDYSNLVNTPASLIQCQGGPAVQLGAQYINNTSTANTPARCGLFTGAPCTGVTTTPQLGNSTSNTGTGADGPHPFFSYNYSFAAGSPFQDNNSNGSIQYIIRASELTAAGVGRGLLRSLQLNVSQKNSTAAWNGFTISIGCTAATAFAGSTGNFLTGLSTVYGPNNLNIAGTGWQTFTFSTPYEWDGTSNIVVQMCYNNSAGAATADGADDVDHLLTTPTTYNSCAYMRYNTGGFFGSPRGCSSSAYNANSTNRPTFRFGFCDNNSPNITYSWSPSTGLSATNISNPTANVAATTTYTVFATDGVCSQTATVVVTLQNCNVCVANAAIAPASTITCGQPSIQLNATVSSPILVTNPPTAFTWAGPVGGIQSGGNTATPTVVLGGIYTVTMTNTAGGAPCTSSATVTVVANNTLPVATIATPPNFTCATQQVTLDAIASTPIVGTAGVTYAWGATAAGTVVSGGSSANPVVALVPPLTSATYTVTITNGNNGCSATGTITVNSNVVPPNVTIATPNKLTCSANLVQLSVFDTQPTGGGPIANPAQDFSWGGAAGTVIVDGGLTARPSVSAIGVYTVTVTGGNGCTITATIEVFTNYVTPNVNAGIDGVKTCATPCVTIGVASTTSNATYSWNDGNTVVPRSACTAGTYTLVVTDPANGCTASDVVFIGVDTLKPNFTIIAPQPLTCANTSRTISGSTTTATPNINWTATGGGTVGITSSPTIASPTVNLPDNYFVTVTNPNNGCTFAASVAVIQDIAPPVAAAGPDVILTCAIPTATLGVTPANPNYTYNWGPGQTNSTLSVSAVGTYTLNVTNNLNGCTAVDQAVVAENKTNPDAYAGPDLLINCNTVGGSVTLGGNPGQPTTSVLGATTDWSGTLSDIPNPSVNAGGTYTVLVTDATNGCTATDVVQVTTNTTAPVPNAGSPQVIRCSPITATIGIANSSGGGVTYAWATTTGNILTDNADGTALVNGAGTYTLSVTDPANGCKAIATTTVTTDTIRPNISAPNYTLTCGVTTVVLNATSTTANTTFDWQAPLTGVSPSVAQAGIYTVLATNNANQCTKTATSTVILDNAAPNVNAGPDKVLTCTVTSVTLGLNPTSTTPNVTYRWSFNNASTSTISVTSAGTYTVTVTNSATTCSTTDEVVVTLDDVRPVAIADDGAPHVLTCSTTSVNLGTVSPTPNVTYNWSAPGGATAVLNVGNIGTYTVTVTSQTNGCSTISAVTVTQNRATPDVTVNAVSSVLNCTNNQSVTVTAQSSVAGATFAWSATNQTPTVIITTLGIYTITVTNPLNGCLNTTTTRATLDTGSPQANAGPPRLITCNVPAVTIGVASTTPNVNYQWSSGPNPLSATQQVNTPGTYTVTVTNNSNGCSSISSVVVTENRTAPIADAGLPQTLTCAIPVRQLGTTAIPNMTYNWSSLLGGSQGFVSAPSQAQPSVSLPSTYTVIVTSQINGCSVSSMVVVSANKIAPDAPTQARVDTLKCNVQTLQIGATSATAGVNYVWSATGSPITDVISVNAIGLYYVTVTNPANGCTARASWRVVGDFQLPVANAGLDKTITCANTSVSLGVNPIAGFSYSWGGGLGSTSIVSANIPATYCLTVTRNRNGCTAQDCVVVTSNTTPPIADAGATKELTCTVRSVTIGAISPTPSVTYTWNNGIGNAAQPVVNLANPAYCVTVTRTDNGCTAVACVAVTSNTTPPDAQADNGANHLLTCGVTSVSIGQLSATPLVTYTWNNGNQNPTQNVSAVGNYTVTVTSLLNGCKASSAVAVTQNKILPIARITTPLPLTCLRTTATLNAATSTPAGGVTYSWFNGTSAPTTTAPTTGTYCVTVTDNINGCTASTCVPVISSVGGVQAVIATPAQITCTNASVTLNACNSVPLNTATFLWNTPGATSTCTASVNAIGIYIVTVTNPSNGCTATASVAVTSNTTLPNANAGGPQELTCAATCRVVGNPSTTPGVRYIWSDGGGSNATATFCAPATYTVTVTDQANGCFATSEVVVSRNVNTPNANAGRDTVITCANPTINLMASSTTPNVSYLWSYGLTANQTVAVGNSGTYTVTVTDNRNSCTTIGQVNVMIDRQNPQLSMGGTQIIQCVPNTIGITASSTTPLTSFLWASTAGNTAFVGAVNNLNSVTVNAAGTYTVTVTSAVNGCSTSGTLRVDANTAPPNANAGFDKYISCSDTLASIGLASTTPNVTYQWTSSIAGNPFVAPTSSTDAVVTVRSVGIYTVVVRNTLTGCTNSDVVTVEARNGAPVIVIPTPQILTCQVNTVTLSAANSSPSGLTFVWSLGNTAGSLITVNAPGTYTVTATNPLTGCTNSRQVEVFQSSNVPSLTETITNITCNGARDGRIDLVITGGANPQVAWADNPNLISPNRSFLGPGSYTVVVTGSDGCSVGTTYIVTQPARLIATASATPSQCSADGTVTATVYGGTTPYSYLWDPGAVATQTVTGLSSGQYSVVVTDANGCQASVGTYVNSLVTITPEAAITKVSCTNGSDGSITMATSGENPPFTYRWTYGSLTSNPLVGIPSGNYDLLITDAIGCQTRRSYFVQQPEYLASTFTVSDAKCNRGCEGVVRTNMTGGNGGYIYTWNINNEHASYLNAVCAGTYTVSVVDIKGCTYSASTLVGEPNPLIVDTVYTRQPTCYQTSDGVLTPSAVGGTPGYSFNWGQNIGSGVVQNIKTGVYTVTVTDVNGCTNTRIVPVPEPPPVLASLSRTNLRCSEDESGTVSVDNVSGGNGGPYTYSIGTASQQQTPFFVGLNAGQYNVHIYDVQGCELVLPITINSTTPLVVDATGPYTIQLGDSIKVTPAITGAGNPNYVYSWTPAATATNPTSQQTWLKPLETTTYKFTVRDTLQGCIASDRVTVEVLNPKNLFIPNVFTPNGDGFNDFFHVTLGLGVKQLKSMRIFDRWGELLYESKNITANDELQGWDGTLRGKKMLPAVFTYTVQVEFDNGAIENYTGTVTLLR